MWSWQIYHFLLAKVVGNQDLFDGAKAVNLTVDCSGGSKVTRAPDGVDAREIPCYGLEGGRPTVLV